MISSSHAADVAALQNFVKLQNECCCKVIDFSLSTAKILNARSNTVKFFSCNARKRGRCLRILTYKSILWEVSDIHDGVLYNGGLTVVMPVASAYSQAGCKTTTRDACNCEGIGSECCK